MGTHPIFESDFDCLTEWLKANQKMAGTGATGTLANLNCLNYLTAEFTAPERIPPYDKEAEDFPSSKLSPKHKERVEKILSSLQDQDSRTQFLKVLINNMISASSFNRIQ